MKTKTLPGRLLPLLALTIASLISQSARTQSLQQAGYVKLLSAAAERQKGVKSDQVRDVLDLFSGGAPSVNAGDVFSALKRDWPEYQQGTPIRVPSEVREGLVTEGKEFDHFVSVVRPLLASCGLERRVRPLLFKSEVPVTMFVFPNALVFSTRAVALLDDAEIDALASHEVVHIVGQPVLVKAVDDHDDAALRLVELFCDAGGAAIIQARGGDPRKLVSGLNKINSVLEIEFQDYQRGTKHPPIKVRKQLNDALVQEFAPAANTAGAGDR
jgi:hypothetical protein